MDFSLWLHLHYEKIVSIATCSMQLNMFDKTRLQLKKFDRTKLQLDRLVTTNIIFS